MVACGHNPSANEMELAETDLFGDTFIMSGDSILVVDDDDLIRREIERALSRTGYQLRTTGSYSDAVVLALEIMPRLLILDISLPGNTGWSLLDEVRRARPEHEFIVLVMSSTQVSRTILRERMVHKFVPKPFDMAYFVESVRELLGC